MAADSPQDALKLSVAQAALGQVVRGSIVGVGTGSTVDRFIDALATIKGDIRGAVSSSERSSQRLRDLGIEVYDCNDVDGIPVYIDGADEIDARGFMIKGGGAALTREKIVADLAERFVCICDESKRVTTLGRFPLPVEVIPMATKQVLRRLEAVGGRPVLRAGVLTDNGCPIIDVHGLRIEDPAALEAEMNQWPGVVCVGIFARNRADLCLLGTAQGVQTLVFRAGAGQG